MSLGYQFQYVKNLLKRYGFWGLVLKTLERKQSPMIPYGAVYRRYLPTEKELKRQRSERFPYMPLISIVVPAYETPEKYLRELLDSVRFQSYGNWELCIADGSGTDLVERVVTDYAKGDGRIRYRRLEKNGGISENTNEGFEMAKGEYIALMDHDDLLSPNALYEMVKRLNEMDSEKERRMAMIYSDEDKVNGDGTVHSRPHFKPDYNPEFLRRNNYFCHFLLFSKELFQMAGGLRKEYDGAQDYDLVLRYVDAGAYVFHIPKILYHWRIHEGSTAGNSEDKAYAFDNGCRAIEAHFKRNGINGSAAVTENLGVYRVAYKLQGEYEITVAAEEERQLRRIQKHYEETSFEDKPYRLHIQYKKIDSFCQEMKKDRAGYLLLIGEGVKVMPDGLIEALLASCQQAQTAAVGVKFVTPKRRVASCGFLYGADGAVVPSCGGLYAGYKGYFLHAVIPQNVSVISFQCAMLDCGVLRLAGVIDERLEGIYRDADYCFRLAKQGYRVMVTPEITAVQQTGGKEEENRPGREAFFKKWENTLKEPDPCYNRNLSLKEGNTYAPKEPFEKRKAQKE